ncbi:MAG: membrane dipeptidase [Clostridia bacterium]|nr:membrane dipeptidase [Clostridia bacterium]
MAIADFHNDILTSSNFDFKTVAFEDNAVITAIFRGKRSFEEAIALTKYSKLIAFEDVGYSDLCFEKMIGANPLYVGLTWNGENDFGYGCDYSFGLKRKGIEFIKELNKYKVAIDTAHISKRGFIDIIDNAEIVVNSHTCFNGIFKHKRNLDDWQIKLLLERGGFIGVACCGYFMTNRKTCKITDYTDNIMYFYEKYGADVLCVGTDFNGTDFVPTKLENYCGFKLVENDLIERGIPKTEVEKILYSNLYNFIKRKIKTA